MTAANWPNCFNLTIASEGEKLDRNSKDRGNWTSGKIGVGELKGSKFGIAAFVYPTVDISNLTKDGAKAIYYRDYWPKVAGDNQPQGVDLIAWDICVNSGASRALTIEADALASKITTAAGVAALANATADKVPLIQKMCALRASFYRGLSTFATFGKGWLSRNASMEANGVRMALAAANVPAPEIKKKLETESTTASNKAATSGKMAGGAASGPATSPAADWHSLDWSQILMLGAAVAVLAGAAIVFFHWYRNHNERAKAYAAVASATGG